jgi:hypothetical protein
LKGRKIAVTIAAIKGTSLNSMIIIEFNELTGRVIKE